MQNFGCYIAYEKGLFECAAGLDARKVLYRLKVMLVYVFSVVGDYDECTACTLCYTVLSCAICKQRVGSYHIHRLFERQNTLA